MRAFRAFRNAPIRRKLTLIMTVTSSVALLLAAAGFVAYELVTFRSSMVRSLQILADIVAQSSAAALAFRDPNAAAETLAVLAADRHVESAALYTADGRVLARYLRPDVPVDHEIPPPEGPGHRFGEQHLVLFRAVVLGGERVGTLYIRSDLRAMHARLTRYAAIVSGVLLVSLLVAILISSRLQVVISGPIGHLAETAALVSRDKNYEVRAVKHAGDELGVLIETFNEMLARIHERDQDLRRAQEHLEKRVAERTEELQTEVLARQQGEETIRKLAYFDALTGLPNRLLFGDRLSQALAHAERAKQLLAVMFLDLDRFKTINDTLGHAMGDRVLQGVADRLRHCIRAQDTVARLGGDEFLLFAQEVRGADDAVRVATKMLEALKPPFEVEGYELHVTASVGISLYPADGADAETLIKSSDSALYRAKDQGRNTHQLFTAAMHDRALERLVLENSIRRALERDELTLHYQPQVSPRTGAIVAVEALLRARSPDLAAVPPAKLVHLAEESGLIVPLGQWVLRTACRQARGWLDAGLPPVRMAINLSAHHFKQKDFVRMIERTAAEAGFPTRYLTLEVTESVIMENAEATIGMLHHVKALGVSLSIDDFGTGYSSLSYLKRLPIDSLKIDRSFVRDIPHDPDDGAIATLIIAIAHTLGLEVVAEGVETEGQLAFLHACDAMQGFLISEAVPAEAMTALLEAMRQGERLLRSRVLE